MLVQEGGVRSYFSGGMRGELQTALEHGQLSIVYQPKMDLVTERVAGVEALLRWSHPERGNVPPSVFIPVAEDSGLIVPIGQWALEAVCRQCASWQQRFSDRPLLLASVNVSAGQLVPDLVDVVSGVISRTGIPAASLCLEVTESMLMEDVHSAITILEQLAALGVALSIDDFGTGYSSLAYLKRFPLDELKIDKSFIDGLGHDPNDTAIVAAVVAMAHALNLRVVAEGIETAEQVERLRTFGCEQGQGYHYARPMPPEAIDALLSYEAEGTWRHHDGQRDRSDHGGSYRAERVLVVDDDDDVRQLARMSLAAVGFDVTEACDGSGAVAAAAAAPPDCVLLDLVMPGMSGLDVCRSLRRDPRTANCTILVLTSNDDAAHKVDAFSVGADDYIVKPFSPRDLSSRVRSALSRRARDVRCGST